MDAHRTRGWSWQRRLAVNNIQHMLTSLLSGIQERPRRPVTPLENTYKMEPEKRFNAKAVENIIEEVLIGQLEEEHYEPRASKQVR